MLTLGKDPGNERVIQDRLSVPAAQLDANTPHQQGSNCWTSTTQRPEVRAELEANVFRQASLGILKPAASK